MFVVLAGCGSGGGSEGKAVGPGRSAPTFRLDNVRSGQPAVALADFRGRPVVLNFWASWCAPCAKEMPAFEAVYRKVKDRIAFVGVDGNDSRTNAVGQLDSTGVTYPSGYDPNDDVYSAYHLIGRPTTMFLSPEGRIVGQHAGELSAAKLEALLAQYFPPS